MKESRRENRLSFSQWLEMHGEDQAPFEDLVEVWAEGESRQRFGDLMASIEVDIEADKLLGDLKERIE